MRVSDNATFESIRRQVNSAHAGVLAAQDQASSGLRVSKPSDDPVAASAARRIITDAVKTAYFTNGAPKQKWGSAL